MLSSSLADQFGTRILSRRQFLATAASGSAALWTGCRNLTDPSAADPYANEPTRLRLAVHPPIRGTPLGTDVLTDANFRRAYIQVPPLYTPSNPAPLAIAFHGFGGRGTDFIGAYSDLTDASGIVLLAPHSGGQTWDAVAGDGFLDDVPFINQMLEQVWNRCVIDPNRIGLIGFSDGATYSLSLGLSNGDQLRGVVAHSPGFAVNVPNHGHPPFFISHGTDDQVLPIGATSRKIVPMLRALGDGVTYVEFSGGTRCPPRSQMRRWTG
jgi:predicted esterase